MKLLKIYKFSMYLFSFSTFSTILCCSDKGGKGIIVCFKLSWVIWLIVSVLTLSNFALNNGEDMYICT